MNSSLELLIGIPRTKGDEEKVGKGKSLSMDLLKTGQMAKVAGVLPSTIRHYTELGLLQAVATTPGGQRLYDEKTTLERLRTIQAIQRQRLPLRIIRKVIQDHREGPK